MARPAGRRITTRDVAARAGVSQPTVSLVLSSHARARVAPATRERVLRAAEELGYSPNLLARGLARRRSYALGIVVPDLRDPFFLDVLGGAGRVAAELGYAVLLCDARDTPVERHIQMLRGRLVDGLLIDAAGAAALPAHLLADMNVVLIDESTAAVPARELGARAARLLVERVDDRAVGTRPQRRSPNR